MSSKPTKYLLLIALLCVCATHSQSLRQRTMVLMGSRFDITVVAKDSLSAEAYIDTAAAEISRIENLISEWKPETEVSRINRNAGVKPVKVSRELLDLTLRALDFSRISNGAFDISFAAANRIWKFDGSMTQLPSAKELRESVKLIGYRNIVVDSLNSTIFLKKKGMKIGFGSIGKGYAADRAKELLVEKGVTAGIVNASGDLNSWGKQPDGEPWTIGITNPLKKNSVFAVLPLDQPAAVTSGNYEKFALINGKRYSHIIDPRTGMPASGLASVTILGESAERANGFSTAIMVLGPVEGLELLNRFSELRGMLVTDAGDVLTSDNLQLQPSRD